MARQASHPSTGEVRLRDVRADDLPLFFEFQLDPDANRMAAFTTRDPADRDAFTAHWDWILSDDSIINKTILVDGQVVGNVASFNQGGEREIGYWIGREYWGKGVATRALSEFLGYERTRPLHARVAKHNLGSIRVLEKCGFIIVGTDKGYANALGKEIEELILVLRANESDEAL